ncbi:MAG: hypothetical protein K2X82_20220 [Gemmataceae bacterium]|nr:hypothetical protein [Gemmataceae bacterium]
MAAVPTCPRPDQYTRWCKLYGQVGEFVSLFSLMGDGKLRLSKAAELIGVAENTARKILREVPKEFGISESEPVYKGNRGAPGETNLPDLSEDGRRLCAALRERLDGNDLSHKAGAARPRPQPLRIAVPEGPLLSRLVKPLTVEPGGPLGRLPVRVSRSYGELKRSLEARQTDLFDAAVVWEERFQPNDFEHWQTHLFEEHTFELLLVCHTREHRELVAAESRTADRIEWYVEDLGKAKGFIAVPKQFPNAAKWFETRYPEKVRLEESVGEVFTRVISGDAAYGVLPSYYEAVDRYRVAELLHYAKLRHDPKLINRCQVALLTKPDHPHFGSYLLQLDAFRSQLADRLKACPDVSPISSRAADRDLPTSPDKYSGSFHGHFIETVHQPGSRTPRPRWHRELIRFDPKDVSGDNLPGGHTVGLKRGFTVNETQVVFDTRGGVIGQHMFYLIADRKPDQNLKRLGREWDELPEFLKAHPKNEGGAEVVDQSFVAFLPYYRELKKDGRAWYGFWLGTNPLSHPLANGMVIASQQLTDAECDSLFQEVRIRFMMAGAGFAGRLATDQDEQDPGA